MNSYLIPRHKVFISYYHKDDKLYKDQLIKKQEYNPNKYGLQSIFDDYSVNDNDIDDTNLTDEEVRQIIRDDYICGATVLILLCGAHTKERKFIDWELHAAMFNTEKNPKLGILVINLPSVKNMNGIYAGENEEKKVISPYYNNWVALKSRAELEEAYPYLPSRIIDNYESSINRTDIVPITIVDWDTISNDNERLKYLIDNAYKRGNNKNLHYNHSAPLRARNTRNQNRYYW